jgi:pyruvate dehydrogenase E1 component alpha subunit
MDVECRRLHGHYVGDPQIYRSKEDLEEAAEHDPITLLREQLGLSDEEFDEVDREIVDIVEQSVEFSKNGTDPKPEDALKNVYA